MFSESITHEERSTRLFLALITCHVGSSMFRLLVVVETFIELGGFVELKRFIELKKFRKKKKNERLSFDASEYLIDLFRKISSDCFTCSFHLGHERLQSS